MTDLNALRRVLNSGTSTKEGMRIALREACEEIARCHTRLQLAAPLLEAVEAVVESRVAEEEAR